MDKDPILTLSIKESEMVTLLDGLRYALYYVEQMNLGQGSNRDILLLKNKVRKTLDTMNDE